MYRRLSFAPPGAPHPYLSDPVLGCSFCACFPINFSYKFDQIDRITFCKKALSSVRGGQTRCENVLQRYASIKKSHLCLINFF